jgi:GT2 family glycosyltransferase
MKTEEANIDVCIITRNRVDLLRQCLLSVGQSTIPVKQVIVSDDSTDDRTYQMVSSEFDNVQYLKGPRKGPAANRNNAVSIADSDYVLFLDDDSRLGESFLERACACLTQSKNPRRTIVTGLYIEHRKLLYPGEQDFLGFQSVDCKDRRTIDNILIGCALFPRELFNEIRFDELTHYDEVDLATRARARDYDILLCRSAVNFHFPVSKDHAEVSDRPLASGSRIYVTHKRYAYIDKNPIKGVAYLLVATAHLLLSVIKREGIFGIPQAFNTIKIAYDYIRRFTRLPEDARKWIS